MQPDRKSPCPVTGIDTARKRLAAPEQPPQPPGSGGTSSPHRYTRRSFIAMFLVGSSVRKIARFHRTREAEVESTIRANMAGLDEIRRREAA